MKTSTLSMFFLLLLFSIICYSQQKVHVEVLTTGTNTSLRGMSVPSDGIIWVSGSNGTIGKSVDSGKTWKWITVPGFEKRDFRDIEAFDSSTAVAMAVDDPAIILKTTDGGITWKKVFERARQGMFLDAMDFRNQKEGICIGDPLAIKPTAAKYFYILRTFNEGDTWQEVPIRLVPKAQKGEAVFAASGTNISFFENSIYEYAFVTGGLVSNLYLIAKEGKQSKTVRVPVKQGSESSGTFSMVTDRERKIYCIGGDYKNPTSSAGNYQYTTNGGSSWDSTKASSPAGYRSCIRFVESKILVACGTTGVDLTVDGPDAWRKISSESFNVCMVSKGKQVFFAGEKGKIGKLIFHK